MLLLLQCVCDRVRRLNMIGVMSGPLEIPRFREALAAVGSSKHGALEQEGGLSHSMAGRFRGGGPETQAALKARRRRVVARGLESCGRRKI